jgi:hypothetical protein
LRIEFIIFFRVLPLRPRALFLCWIITTSVHEITAISKNGFVKWENRWVNVDVNVSISSVKFWSGVSKRLSKFDTRKYVWFYK